MTLEIYISLLNEFVKENPDALQKQVIYSCDDEGNCHSPVLYGPDKYKYVKGVAIQSEKGYNAVCIN